MRVPTSLLPHTVTVEPFEGTAGSGAPVYGDEFTLRARVEGRRRMIRKPDGTDVVATAAAIVRPDASIPVESRLTHDGRTYEVLDVLTGQGLTRASHLEVILE